MTYSIETSDKSEETSSLLLSQNDWTVPGYGEKLSRDRLLRRFDSVVLANNEVEGDISDELHSAYETSVQFVDYAFGVFENTIETDRYDWVFAVPARGEQSQGNEYESEVTFFLPLVSSRFGVQSLARQAIVSDLVPTVIEEYKGNEQGIRGALLWTPVYFSPSVDNREFVRNLSIAHFRVNEAAQFARNTLGAKVMGLGAIIPGLTKSGTTISQEGLVTTTGHGGTVHLVAETVREVAERMDKSSTVGVLGLGAIGYASLEVLRENNAELSIKEYVVYDVESSKISNAINSNRSKYQTLAVDADIQLLEQSDIIVTAVTKPIDLDEREFEYGRPIDLSGKIIIDDSQPGCFDRQQVEARGGKLIWVVGQDSTEQHAFKRIGGYNFGEMAGLYEERSVWGCEAEAGSIAMNKAYEHAVNTHVTPDIARKIGKICYDSGVRVSRPLQSFGKPVDI